MYHSFFIKKSKFRAKKCVRQTIYRMSEMTTSEWPYNNRAGTVEYTQV